jgi:Na+-transporting NADH:ubiquinone oxidoreductase subunit NqrF
MHTTMCSLRPAPASRPFRGMVRELLQAVTGTVTSRIHLIAGSPYTTDLLYHREFLALQEAHDNFRYHTAISRETAALPPAAAATCITALEERDGDVRAAAGR